jgi:hypothetical protein
VVEESEGLALLARCWIFRCPGPFPFLFFLAPISSIFLWSSLLLIFFVDPDVVPDSSLFLRLLLLSFRSFSFLLWFIDFEQGGWDKSLESACD